MFANNDCLQLTRMSLLDDLKYLGCMLHCRMG